MPQIDRDVTVITKAGNVYRFREAEKWTWSEDALGVRIGDETIAAFGPGAVEVAYYTDAKAD